ncbi:cytidylate kinase [Paenibacillus turicensis]|uniref:Cytidylate kinase n=1 Tax=Paenibacillus turicensis TaxID=160487 RepID=A0ABS4FY43_9BACL|nr:(d)CMP kinase [Paenibacillus turicensis]MBP1907503.1 cytidylate kinase [Paenibacillus turicensis]
MANGVSLQHNKINIAIDGPAGAGKSTIARMVANQLGYVYVDTGAMYRAATLYFVDKGIPPEQSVDMLEALNSLQIVLEPGEERQQVFLNNRNVTDEIRSNAVNNIVSQYSQLEALRTRLVALQQQMATRKGVVMDGRDIGTTVLPDAEVKIYMTASVEERAARRYNEMSDKESITLEQLKQDIQQRDQLDQQREISPLTQAHDAILLDTTSMTIEQVVDAIISYCNRQGMESKA